MTDKEKDKEKAKTKISETLHAMMKLAEEGGYMAEITLVGKNTAQQHYTVGTPWSCAKVNADNHIVLDQGDIDGEIVTATVVCLRMLRDLSGANRPMYHAAQSGITNMIIDQGMGDRLPPDHAPQPMHSARAVNAALNDPQAKDVATPDLSLVDRFGNKIKPH